MLLLFVLGLETEELSFFDSRRSCETKAVAKLCNVNLVSLEDSFEKIGSEVVDVGSISIKGSSVEIITFVNKLSESVIDPDEFVC